MKNRSIIFFVLSVFAHLSLAHAGDGKKKETVRNSQYFDLLNYDLTKMELVNARQVSVFGVHLGMTIQAMKNRISNNRLVFLMQDKFNNNRFYLYDIRKEHDEHIPLAYFKWDHRDSGLREIIVYPGFARFMVGKSKRLVTADVMDFQSDIVKEFLGYPSKKEVTLDVPSIQLFHTTYYYPGRYFEVIKQVSGNKIKYAFGIFDIGVKDKEVGKRFD